MRILLFEAALRAYLRAAYASSSSEEELEAAWARVMALGSALAQATNERPLEAPTPPAA